MPLKGIDTENIKLRLKDAFTKNYRYKIIALIIAIAAWAYVSIDENKTIVLDVELRLDYSNETGFTLIGERPKYVTVTLRGPTDIVRSLGPAQLKANLDIGIPVKGEKEYDITARQIYVPDDNVKCLRVSPSKIKLNFQKYIDKK